MSLLDFVQHSAAVDKHGKSREDLGLMPSASEALLFSFYSGSDPEISTQHALEKSLALIFEPKPFKDGTQLEALADSSGVFVPIERKADVNPHYEQELSALQDPSLIFSTNEQPAPKVSKCFQHQEDRWDDHYQELLRYKQLHGNCHVPQNYPESLPLARWARRQRHQYKRKCQGKKSSMSDERQRLLEQAGFVWDPQMDVWEIRRQELDVYKERHGDCNVPSRYAENPKLATWVKRQRRQYKQMKAGIQSRLPSERFDILDRMGFVWKHRETTSSIGSNSTRRT